MSCLGIGQDLSTTMGPATSESAAFGTHVTPDACVCLQRELAAFMAGVNPGVRLTPIQMREIVEQVRDLLLPCFKDPVQF